MDVIGFWQFWHWILGLPLECGGRLGLPLGPRVGNRVAIGWYQVDSHRLFGMMELNVGKAVVVPVFASFDG